MYTSGNTGAIQIFQTVPHHPGIDRSVAVRSVTVVSLSRFYGRHLLFQLVARNHSIASFSSHSSVSAPTILVIVCCPFWLPQLLFLFALSTESESSNWFPWFVSVFCFTLLVVWQKDISTVESLYQLSQGHLLGQAEDERQGLKQPDETCLEPGWNSCVYLCECVCVDVLSWSRTWRCW